VRPEFAGASGDDTGQVSDLKTALYCLITGQSAVFASAPGDYYFCHLSAPSMDEGQGKEHTDAPYLLRYQI